MDASANDPAAKRPVGIALISFFFVFGALASGLAGFMLLLPRTPLDTLWRLNPHAREGFAPMGLWAVFLMSMVFVACAAAALGLWHRRRWGYWTAISILGINLLGDAINTFVLRDWRTVIGVPIAALMIAYLFRDRMVFGPKKSPMPHLS